MSPKWYNYPTVLMTLAADLSIRVRQRLRLRMAEKRYTQRDVAGLTGWSQSRIAKVLSGRTAVDIDELGAFCAALGMSPVETVRDPGLEFVADLTPYELRVLERFRAIDPKLQEAVATILNVKKPTTPQRYATDPTKKGRLPRPPITAPMAAAAK
jgi:transcriptional regulator with XRE-family HTH domain